MATTVFGDTNAVVQAAESEVTWVISWGLRRDEWFNFQLSPDFSTDDNDEKWQTTLETTRQWVTASAFGDLQAWFVVKNASPPGTSVDFTFCGLRSQG
jgi:hypothetical protein